MIKYSFTKKYLAILLLFFSLPVVTCAQSWIQHSNGLIPGSVLSITTNTTNLIAGTSGGGVFYSTNSGANWSNISSNLPQTEMTAIYSVDTNIYVGTGGYGIYKSTNGGASWSAQNAGLSSRYLHCLTNLGTWIFAGTRAGGVYHSSNNAASWITSSNGLPPNSDVRSLATRGTVLFAGTDFGVYVSVDSGANWSQSNTGLTTIDVSFLLSVSGNLYAGTNGGGVFKSTDGGQHWSVINTGITNYNITSLAYTTNLFAGTSGGGVFLSTNGGANWSVVNNSIQNIYIECLNTIGSIVYAGTLYGPGGGIYSTTDNGTTWSLLTNGLTQYAKISSFLLNGNNMFVSGEGGVSVSTDTGITWANSSNGLPTNIVVNTIAVNGSVLFAGTQGKGVYISTNAGANWAQANNGLHNNPIICSIIVNSSAVFAASDSGVYVSSNNGSTWSSYRIGLTTSSKITDLVFVDTVLFASSAGNGVYKSINRGLSWTAVSSGIPTSLAINDLAVSGSNIFAATDGGGIYFTTNMGSSWSSVNTGLSELFVRQIFAYGSNVFAGTFSGVFISNDNGTNWTKFFSTGLTNNNVQSLFVTSNTLFAGTIGGGIFTYDISAALVLGKLPKTSFCTTNQFTIPVIAIGTFNTGNIFTAELSDTLGGFSNPLDIGTMNSTNSGNLTAVIPAIVKSGIHYRIKLRSSSPYQESDDNGTDLTVNPLPNVSLQTFNNVCASDPPFTLTGGLPAGGTYTGLGVSNGKFNPGSVGAGAHSITYTFTDSNSCTNSATQPIQVLPLPTVSMDSLNPVCVYAGPINLAGGNPSGGTYSGPGVSNGTFYPSQVGPGTFTINYTIVGSNGCTNTASTKIKVNPKPSVVLTNFQDVCMDTKPFDLTGGFPAGGTYSGDGVISGKFYPALAGTGNHNIYYSYKDSNGCEDSVSRSIHVYPQPQKPAITRGGDELAASPAAAYQWYYKDTPISGATGQYFKPDSIGFYTVEITDIFGCTAYSDPFYFTGTGVDEMVVSGSQCSIFPNPTDGKFFLNFSDNSVSNIEVFIKDLLGNDIRNYNFTNTGSFVQNIDISDFSSGTYFIEIITDRHTIVKKIIKN